MENNGKKDHDYAEEHEQKLEFWEVLLAILQKLLRNRERAHRELCLLGCMLRIILIGFALGRLTGRLIRRLQNIEVLLMRRKVQGQSSDHFDRVDLFLPEACVSVHDGNEEN